MFARWHPSAYMLVCQCLGGCRRRRTSQAQIWGVAPPMLSSNKSKGFTSSDTRVYVSAIFSLWFAFVYCHDNFKRSFVDLLSRGSQPSEALYTAVFQWHFAYPFRRSILANIWNDIVCPLTTSFSEQQLGLLGYSVPSNAGCFRIDVWCKWCSQALVTNSRKDASFVQTKTSKSAAYPKAEWTGWANGADFKG